MLSIFLAFLIHFIAQPGVAAIAGGGPADRAVVQTPVTSPGHHVHTFDSAGGPPST
jgi:hypothetical protein